MNSSPPHHHRCDGMVSYMVDSGERWWTSHCRERYRRVGESFNPRIDILYRSDIQFGFSDSSENWGIIFSDSISSFQVFSDSWYYFFFFRISYSFWLYESGRGYFFSYSPILSVFSIIGYFGNPVHWGKRNSLSMMLSVPLYGHSHRLYQSPFH